MRWVASYLLGLVGQQLLLQSFLNNRVHDLMQRLAPTRAQGLTVLIAAALFAAAHLPNLPLVALTGVAGAFWTWHFRRHANFLLLCASHLLLGVAAMLMLGKGPLLSLRVGYGAWKKMAAD